MVTYYYYYVNLFLCSSSVYECMNTRITSTEEILVKVVCYKLGNSIHFSNLSDNKDYSNSKR